MRLAWERLDRIYDPGTPAQDLADLLAEQYGGESIPPRLVTTLLERGSTAGRLAGAAEAMLASGDAEPSVTALTFGAAVASAGGDSGRARRLLDRALAVAGNPDTRLDVIEHLHQRGWRAEAIELLEARLRDEPGDLHAAEHYAQAIEDAFARFAGEEPASERPCGERPPAAAETPGRQPTAAEPGEGKGTGTEPAGRCPSCPCGQDAPWEECCAPRERAALRRFTDRSGLAALREALDAYAARSGYREAIDEEAAEWLPAGEDAGPGPAGRAVLADLAAELGLLTAGIARDEENGEEDAREGFRDRVPAGEDGRDRGGDKDEEDNAVAAFTADPSVPPELAARARAWREHMHYGLWRASGPRPVPSPGLWCTDIATGISRYVETPPDLAGALSHWAVWLGGAVPDSGIWRFTGAGMRLSPAEGDAAVQLVRMAAEALAYEIAGKPGKSDALRRAAETMPFGRAEPHGVAVEFGDPAPPLLASLIKMTSGALLPRIVADVCEHRAAGEPADLAGLAAAPLAASDARRWLDEPLPALRGRTPRRAAASWSAGRAVLETLLRQFEYEAGLPAHGKPVIDTAWLRRELDMDEGPED